MLDGLFNGFVCSKRTHQRCNLQGKDLPERVCVCVHVCAAWASCLKEAHLILFYRERQHIPVKLNGFSASVLPQT